MIGVRQRVITPHPEAWRALAADAAVCELLVLVDDLDAAAAATARHGVPHAWSVRHGDAVLVARPADAHPMTLVRGAMARGDDAIAVMPIIYTRDVDPLRAWLTALGLTPRIAADAGTWLDLSAGAGGLVALHALAPDAAAPDRTPRTEASFEFRGNLDALRGRLLNAGFDASVHDEAYNRTLTVRAHAGTVFGEVWINSAQDDLHGFRRLG